MRTVGLGAGLETIRAQIAAQLGVDPDAVDPDGDLIAQGLDSIRMMGLAGRWRREGVDIDFARLAASPSVRAWAALLSSADALTARASSEGGADGADEAPFPLAPMQHAMWVGRDDGQQLGGVAAHLYVEFDGTGLDPERLRRAATRLAARHPMLRVRFLPDGTQRTGAPPAEYPVTVDDLRGMDSDAVAARLAAVRAGKSAQRLDGQVLEVTLTLLPGGRTRLHVDLDMQAADAMSYRTLMADLAKLYRDQPLASLDYTYRQYRQHVSGTQPVQEADRQWWASRIAQLPDPPALPTVPTGQQADAHRSGRRWHWLDPQTRDALFARAHRRGITPAMLLAASFADTVAGWSADRRFLLNVPLFAREPLHPDIDEVVGDFTSSLLIDVDLPFADTPTVRARRLQEAVQTAAAHSSYPGLSVLRDLTRHRGTQTLAPVVFTSALGLGELFSSAVTTEFGTPVWIISQGPQVLLDAQVTEFDGGILVNWDVREDAFRPGVIDAMFARHIDEVLRLATDEHAWETPPPPPLPVAQQAVRDAVNSVTAPRSGQLLHDGFFAAAAARPDAPAIYSSLGDLTYAQLREQAIAVAAALQDAGVSPGDTVAVLGPKNAEQIAALLGILAAGGLYLPIGVDQPAERAQRIIASGAVTIALVCGAELPELPVPAIRVADAIRRGAGREIAMAATDPTQLSYVLFTSGSTGEPKGVELTHEAVQNTVEFINAHFDIGPDDRCLALNPLEGDISVLDIFATLAAGAAIVVVDEEHRRDPDHWARLIERHRVTVLHFQPGWLAMLLEVAGPLPSLRVVATGGDWVTPAMARGLRELAPGVRFAGLGGATETAIHHTICEVADPPAHWTAVPFGTPLPNNRCRIVDSDGNDRPDWVVGELWSAGKGVARGYRGRPDLTAERFVQHDGHTWYRTGDLARYWPDGTCEFVGRADHRVKISGYRVELGEVEAALRRIPGVRGAVAATVAGTATGEQLTAAVCVDDLGVTAESLRAELVKAVPPHMVPRRIRLVDHIPYTVGGKIDRPAIARTLESDAQEPTEPRPPSTALESALTTMVAPLLGLPQIGVDDDFFTLGGDSVLATAAVARIRQRLDIPDMAVADLFAARTVAVLATLLAGRQPEGRLEKVAELYLEVAAMDAGDVASELTGTAYVR